MIDCHAHYYSPHFQPSQSDIPEGLVVITVSETVSEANQILDLSRQFPFLKPSAGIHPEYISNLDPCLVDVKLSELDGFMNSYNSELVSIGECGLDYSIKVIPKELEDIQKEKKRELQLLVLRRHITYGKDFDLPLVLIFCFNYRTFTREMLDIMLLKSCISLSQEQYCMHLMVKLIMHYRVFLMICILVFRRVLLDPITLKSWLNKFH